MGISAKDMGETVVEHNCGVDGVTRMDAGMGSVHEREGIKPFSTALLLTEGQRRQEAIRAGEEMKIRFTFLDDT